MPVAIGISGIFPPKNVMNVAGEAVLHAIQAALEGPVEKLLVDSFEKRVQGWSGPPTFKGELTASTRVFSLLVAPKGKGKIKWERVSGGTDGHYIGVRRARALLIRDYSPHTKPGNVYGGPGSYSSTGYAKPIVWHPGIKPREFERHIAADTERHIYTILYRAANSATVKI